jgi:HK97 family phage prohead protease
MEPATLTAPRTTGPGLITTEGRQSADLHRRAADFDLVELDLKTRTIVGVITTSAVDRYREIVDPGGISLDNYRKNPVVLLNHGWGYSLPIGRNLWIKPQKKGLIASTEFDESPIALDVLRMYDQGYMKGWSIGFIGVKWEDADASKLGFWRKWTETELVEYSAVTIPANPEAISNALSICEDPNLRSMLQRGEGGLHLGGLTEERLSDAIDRIARLESSLAAIVKSVGEHALVDRILSSPINDPDTASADEPATAPTTPTTSGLEMSGRSLDAFVRRSLLETLGR